MQELMIEKTKNILKYIIIALSTMIIIINITLIIKSEINDNEIPDFFGYTPFIIVSGSMEPNILVNDMIITKKIKSDNIKVGDIISYKDEKNDIVITHRVISIQEIEGVKYFETKGDKNKSSDKNLVSYSQIEGKYLFKIPLIGLIINYVKEPRGMILVIIFISCIYLIYDIIVREYTKKKYKARISQ